jgi:hypothetical protein
MRIRNENWGGNMSRESGIRMIEIENKPGEGK